MKSWTLIIATLVVGILALGSYGFLLAPSDVEAMGSGNNSDNDNAMTLATISLATAVVSLLTSIVGLILKLIELSSKTIEKQP